MTLNESRTKTLPRTIPRYRARFQRSEHQPQIGARVRRWPREWDQVPRRLGERSAAGVNH